MYQENKTNNMKQTIKQFTQDTLYNASSKLLYKLGIQYSSVLKNVTFDDYFEQNDFSYKYINEAKKCIEHIWNIGFVDDSSFKQNEQSNEKTNQRYESMDIFACEIKSDCNFSRPIAVALTRAFNRVESKAVNNEFDMPVIVIMKQVTNKGTMLSIATCDRDKRKDGFGEKVGKVTILRNMNCENLHPGHKQILERISNDVSDCSSYEELHEKWFKSFSIDVLSDEFFNGYKAIYEDIVEYVTGKRMVKKSGKWVEQNNGMPCKEIMDEFAGFDNPEKAVRDYVKNLMGRLVFIQFLQKKGWMGVPAGDRWIGGDTEFLQNLFGKSDKKETFIDDVLEPLFNDLNTKRHGDLVTNQNVGIGIKVPYLNGGLFELDKSDDTKFPLPSRFMKNLLDFFASYNFTIDENAPDDVEIGVDPEMLGRIFENLLEDNKEKGAFYTPKEIVQYMCRESLIAYLTTCVLKKQGENHKPEEKIRDTIRKLLSEPETVVPRMTNEQLNDFNSYIRNVKICDPAIGSGAFPMGLLNELFRCRKIIGAWAKDSYGNILTDDDAALKAEIICNNIYGVDIEKGAIDIARLRFWLSIIVDLKTPHALPNFDYKFMQGNSLITTFNQEYVNLDTKKQKHIKVKEMKAEKLKLYNLKQKHYGAQGVQKHELSVEIKKSILRLISMQVGYELRSWYQKNIIQGNINFDNPNDISFAVIRNELPIDKQEIVNSIETLYEKLSDSSIDISKRAQIDINFFDWRMMFTEVFDVEGGNGGFDIVIGNPPYVESRNSNIDENEKDAIQWQLKQRHTEQDVVCFPRGADLLIFFFELSFDISSSYGINTFITENSWLSTDYGYKFQNYILRNINTLGIIDSDYKYFDTADINTVITFFEKKGLRNVDTIPFIHCHGDLSIHPYKIQDINANDKTITINRFNINNELLSRHKWGFLFSIDNRLLSLLEIVSNKEDREFRKKIDIGQGLNLTKDCILRSEGVNTSPYFISDNGPLYRWNNSLFFVDNSKVSKTRKKPLLILPRGLGAHFCCMNEINGYSASYVEIYEKSNLSNDEKLMLWTFCNSSLCWILREFTGRCNLGGGMLKAEATDLKRIPLCFKFDNVEEIRSIFSVCRNQKVHTNIDMAVTSPIHKRIDNIVYKYFGLPTDNNFVTDLLLNRVHWRTDKSKNKKKK